MERKKKYSQGPWSVLESDELEGDYNVCDENLDEVMLGPVCKDEEETLANCFLTAAAPELLEALEALLPYAEKMLKESMEEYIPMVLHDAIIDAKRAIAKAYGEEASNK